VAFGQIKVEIRGENTPKNKKKGGSKKNLKKAFKIVNHLHLHFQILYTYTYPVAVYKYFFTLTQGQCKYLSIHLHGPI
jgi:hypothetical protein